jgi:hypothetical protein
LDGSTKKEKKWNSRKLPRQQRWFKTGIFGPLQPRSNGMASSDNIKNWINEIRTGKSFSGESILIQKNALNQTRITLLDIACCTTNFIIPKQLEDIEKEDILAHQVSINHRH